MFDANPSWLQLLGYSGLEEVIGKHPDEVSAPIQPGGERAEALVKKYIANALENGSARFEWVVLRRDGTEIPIEVFLTPIQLGGRQLIQAVCNDITVRKRAEEELRQSEARLRESEARFSIAFRASPVLITISRLSDARFVEANDAFVRWIGLSRDKIVGHDSRELGIWVDLNDRAKFLTDLRAQRFAERGGVPTAQPARLRPHHAALGRPHRNQSRAAHAGLRPRHHPAQAGRGRIAPNAGERKGVGTVAEQLCIDGVARVPHAVGASSSPPLKYWMITRPVRDRPSGKTICNLSAKTLAGWPL